MLNKLKMLKERQTNHFFTVLIIFYKIQIRKSVLVTGFLKYLNELIKQIAIRKYFKTGVDIAWLNLTQDILT